MNWDFWFPDSQSHLFFVIAVIGCRNVPGMCLIKMLGATAAQIAGKVNILMTVAVFLGEMAMGYV